VSARISEALRITDFGIERGRVGLRLALYGRSVGGCGSCDARASGARERSRPSGSAGLFQCGGKFATCCGQGGRRTGVRAIVVGHADHVPLLTRTRTPSKVRPRPFILVGFGRSSACRRGVMATCPIIHQPSESVRFRPTVLLLFWASDGFFREGPTPPARMMVAQPPSGPPCLWQVVDGLAVGVRAWTGVPLTGR
jgi:hypothetical protein